MHPIKVQNKQFKIILSVLVNSILQLKLHIFKESSHTRHKEIRLDASSITISNKENFDCVRPKYFLEVLV